MNSKTISEQIAGLPKKTEQEHEEFVSKCAYSWCYTTPVPSHGGAIIEYKNKKSGPVQHKYFVLTKK